MSKATEIEQKLKIINESQNAPYNVYLFDRTSTDMAKIANNKLRFQFFKRIYSEINFNPTYKASPKHGNLKGIWTRKVKGNNYRIAYYIDKNNMRIGVLMLGTHEGFYDRLSQYISSKNLHFKS